MSLVQAREHLEFLTEDVRSPIENLLLLRSSLESALFKLGYDQATVKTVLDEFYQLRRTLH